MASNPIEQVVWGRCTAPPGGMVDWREDGRQEGEEAEEEGRQEGEGLKEEGEGLEEVWFRGVVAPLFDPERRMIHACYVSSSPNQPPRRVEALVGVHDTVGEIVEALAASVEEATGESLKAAGCVLTELTGSSVFRFYRSDDVLDDLRDDDVVALYAVEDPAALFGESSTHAG